MDNKHFIWIVPLILIVGFVLGYVSGLHIPKDITIGVDKDFLGVWNKSLDKDSVNFEYKKNLSRCMWNLDYYKDISIEDNTSFDCYDIKANENDSGEGVFKCRVGIIPWNTGEKTLTFERVG